MFKNQLQELAQRSCFNLPSYSCIREGPDHAPRFKATVNFSGETFESPSFCSTLRQAENDAAEVALNTLATRGPSKALAARVLDETGVYKNLLQETAHKAGLNLPVYTTLRTGPGHVPVFSCKVELAGLSFTGEPARTKKQAQKNAAIAAWSALKRLSQRVTTVSTSSSSSLESKCSEEQDQVVIARFLSSLQQSESKHIIQNEWQHEHQRYMQVCKNLTPQASSVSFAQCQSLVYPSFSPEMALYQMFQQEQLLQLQNHLLTLPVSPAPPIAPHILPYMQSIVHPNHCTYVSAGKQGPLPVAAGPSFSVATSSPLYLSSQSDPEPMRSRSTVTIQEILEEKTEESSKCSTSIVPESLVPVHTNAASRIREPILDSGNQKNIDLEESKINEELESRFQNVHLEGNQSRQSEWTSHRNLDSDFRKNLRLQNSRGVDSSHSHRVPLGPPRLSSLGCPRRPPSAAAPVVIRTVGPVSPARPIPPNLTSCRLMPAPPTIRTGVPSHSTRPGNRNMHTRQVNPRFMAPAVRIRTVVPVCSAPPPGQMPSSIQEGTLPDREKKNTVLEGHINGFRA